MVIHSTCRGFRTICSESGRGEVRPAQQRSQLVNEFESLTRRSEGVSREDQFGRWLREVGSPLTSA